MASRQPRFDDLSKDEQIKLIWTENQWLYIFVGFFIGVVFFPLLQALVSNADELLLNLAPEAIGIAVTVLLIDRLNRRRDERNAIKALKTQLIRSARSTVNAIAVNAVHELKERGMLVGDDGLLANENLIRANLQGAELREANLQGANLFLANLQDADLTSANLQNAKSFWANLQNASLVNANLQSALLFESNLQSTSWYGANLQAADLARASLKNAHLGRVSLQRANLRGANLQGAELREANLQDAKFDANTIRPDGQFWNPNIDLRIFTYPQHPNFWAPPKQQKAD
jgi:hypothetical protein